MLWSRTVVHWVFAYSYSYGNCRAIPYLAIRYGTVATTIRSPRTTVPLLAANLRYSYRAIPLRVQYGTRSVRYRTRRVARLGREPETRFWVRDACVSTCLSSYLAPAGVQAPAGSQAGAGGHPGRAHQGRQEPVLYEYSYCRQELGSRSRQEHCRSTHLAGIPRHPPRFRQAVHQPPIDPSSVPYYIGDSRRYVSSFPRETLTDRKSAR